MLSAIDLDEQEVLPETSSGNSSLSTASTPNIVRNLGRAAQQSLKQSLEHDDDNGNDDDDDDDDDGGVQHVFDNTPDASQQSTSQQRSLSKASRKSSSDRNRGQQRFVQSESEDDSTSGTHSLTANKPKQRQQSLLRDKKRKLGSTHGPGRLETNDTKRLLKLNTGRRRIQSSDANQYGDYENYNDQGADSQSQPLSQRELLHQEESIEDQVDSQYADDDDDADPHAYAYGSLNDDNNKDESAFAGSSSSSSSGLRVVQTPVCNDLLNLRSPSLNDFLVAANELRVKWVDTLKATAVGSSVAQLLLNFGLEYNSERHQLRFVTNKAVLEQSYQLALFARTKRQQIKRKRFLEQQAAVAGSDSFGEDADHNGAEDDDNDGAEHQQEEEEEPLPDDNMKTCVYDVAALRHACDSEIGVISAVRAVCSETNMELEASPGKLIRLRRSLTDIVDIILNANSVLQHWFQSKRLAVTHKQSIETGVDTADVNYYEFPSHLSGLEGRLLAREEVCNDIFHKSMSYLLQECGRMKYRRSGKKLYVEKFIPKMTIVLNKDGMYVCDVCGETESQHPMRDVEQRSEHVFKALVDEDSSVQYGTFAWIPAPDFDDIAGFVRTALGRTRAPSLFGQSLGLREKLIKELEQTVNDLDLPVLDRVNKLANSFQNGVVFLETAEFVPYDQLDREKHSTLTSHYVDAWYHDAQYRQALKGPPMLSGAEDRPPAYRFKHVYENLCCGRCGCSTRHHNSRACTAKKIVNVHTRCLTCNKPVAVAKKKKTATSKNDDDDRDDKDAGGDGDGGDDKVSHKRCSCGPQLQQRYMVDVFSALRDGNTTPCIDGILETQLGHHADYNELYFWVLVMLGRFLFPLDPKKYDNWEKMLCFFGNAGCGKSTLLNAIKLLISPVDLGTLSMNAQETFGLASLIGPNKKQLKCLIYEVTGKFKIPAQQFQSMMSADSMNINIKNAECYTTEAWHEHVIMAGNAKPAWQDLGGAISRRMMPFYMRKDIVLKDGNIGKRIQSHEIGAFLFKIVTAYHYARRLYGTKDPYDADPYDSAQPRGRKIVPQTILAFSETIKKDMNPLWNLITQGLNTCATPLELDPDFYITKDDFVKQYNDYLARHFKACDAPFTADLYEPVFPKFGIKVKLETRPDPADLEGPPIRTEWIRGIGIRANYMSQINDKVVRAQQAEMEDAVAEIQADAGPDSPAAPAPTSATSGLGNEYDVDDDDDQDDEDDDGDDGFDSGARGTTTSASSSSSSSARSSSSNSRRRDNNNDDNDDNDGDGDAHWVATVLAALKKKGTGSSQDAVALTKSRFQRLLRSMPIKFRYDALAAVVEEMDPPGSAQEANTVLEQVFYKMDVQTSK